MSQSRKPLVVEFTKMTGAGNDFIVLDNRFFMFTPDELSGLALRYCPRRSSVGADGLLALEASRRTGCDYRMVYYNADGSRGSMCGNGARCLARFAVLAGIDGPSVEFEADAGLYRAEVPDTPDAPVRLFLPPYEDFRSGCRPKMNAERGDPESVDYIWTGTDHIVVFVDDVRSTPVGDYGPRLRADVSISADGANVNFVEVVDSGETCTATVHVRTYERGVEAETQACGTGAVASAIVSMLKERISSPSANVVMPGGVLTVHVEGMLSSPSSISLEGPAEIVYRATLDVWPAVVSNTGA